MSIKYSPANFRRPSSGAYLFLDYSPGVTLHSTPGFSSGAPFGCYRGGRTGPRVGSGSHVDRERRRPIGSSPLCARSFSAGGAVEYSPECSVAELREEARPILKPLTRGDGKRGALKITLIKRKAMRLQEKSKFLKERDAPVMFFLSLNVTVNFGQHRLTHCKRAVSFLPREASTTLERSRDPAGGICLQIADKLGDGLVLPQFCQEVNVVRSSVDDHRDSSLAPNRAAKIFMNSGTDLRRQPWFTPLCREDDVIEQIAMGGTHSGGGFCRPSSGAWVSLDHIPGVRLRSTPGFDSAAPCGRYYGLMGNAMSADCLDGGFRRPFSGALLFLDHRPGVPLRSTPGFSSAAPSGCYRGSQKRLGVRRLSAEGAMEYSPEWSAAELQEDVAPTIAKPLTRGDGSRAC